MTQAVPLALVAPSKPGLANVGFLVRSAATYNTILTNWTAVAEAGTNTGYYPVLSTVEVPDAGALIEFRQSSNTGTFLSAVTVDPVPTNFTAAQVWGYTEGDRSLSGPQAVNSAVTLGLIQAFVQGRFRINYTLGKAYQYGTDGTVLQEFNLRDADGNMAINAQNAVDRIPIGGAVAPIGLSLSLADLEDVDLNNPVDGSIPIWNNGELDLSPAVVRSKIIGGGSF